MTKHKEKEFLSKFQCCCLQEFETTVHISKPCCFQGQAVQKQRDRLSRKYVEGMV